MTNLTDRIQAARTKADQARVRVQALEARQSSAARKIDTRRRIILGALLIDRAARDRDAYVCLVDLMRLIARDADKQAFEGFAMPDRPTPLPPPVLHRAALPRPGNPVAAVS